MRLIRIPCWPRRREVCWEQVNGFLTPQTLCRRRTLREEVCANMASCASGGDPIPLTLSDICLEGFYCPFAPSLSSSPLRCNWSGVLLMMHVCCRPEQLGQSPPAAMPSDPRVFVKQAADGTQCVPILPGYLRTVHLPDRLLLSSRGSGADPVSHRALLSVGRETAGAVSRPVVLSRGERSGAAVARDLVLCSDRLGAGGSQYVAESEEAGVASGVEGNVACTGRGRAGDAVRWPSEWRIPQGFGGR